MTHPLIANPDTYYQDNDYLSNSSLSNFVDIPGYDGLYQICISRNVVRSLKYGDLRELKQRIGRHGHYAVALMKNGKVVNTSVHRIAYEMHNGPIPDGMVVCHNDSNPRNNHPENLRIDTQGGNIQDCIRLRRHNSQTNNPTPGFKGKDSPVAIPVGMYSKDGILLKTFDTITDAAKYIGRGLSCISEACSGRQKTSAGYVWKYL